MKLVVHEKNFVFEMTKNYKLFQNLNSKKSILKKGKYKTELFKLFNELKNIPQNKQKSETYIILKKCFKKYTFNLNNANLKNFIINFEKTNLIELKTINSNMF